MNKTLNYAAILSIAIAGAAWTAPRLWAENPVDAPGEHARAAIDKTEDAANAGIKKTADLARKETNETVDAKTARDIHARIASLVSDAVTRNGFDHMIGSLDKSTRDRIGLERYKDFDKLNGAVDQFRQTFHTRYQHDFELKSALFKDSIPVYRGPDKDHARVTLASFDTRGGNAPGETLPPADKTADASNTDKAVAQNNMDLNFVIEGVIGNGWRLQTPATLSARQLSDSLYNELNKMSTELATLPNSKNPWPADMNEAYLKASRHILWAIESSQPSNVTAENR
jgi:hypothetical protein